MNYCTTNTRANILIADDNPVNISMLRCALRQDYELCSASDGITTLNLAKELRPDLILLDIMMPGMTGFEVMKALSDDPTTADIPVIVITALDQRQDEAQGLGLGAVDYIHKPFDISLIKLRVKNQLEREQQKNLLKTQKTALEEALVRVKKLEGIITICMHCKQIRTPHQSWQQLESYISEHSEAMFSHGVCPSCATIHYPEFATKVQTPHMVDI